MGVVGIIGGSGLTRLNNLQIRNRRVVRTPFGEASGPLTFGNLGGRKWFFWPAMGMGTPFPRIG